MISEYGTYNPAGLFSMSHIVAFLVCFALVVVCVFLAKDLTQDNFKPCFITIATVISLLLFIEIMLNIYAEHLKPENILPIGIELLFVAFMWLSLLKNKAVAYVSKVVVAFVGTSFGVFFLIFTLPSVTNYPIFHVKCFFEIAISSLMLFIGIMIFKQNEVKLNAKSLKIALVMMLAFLVDCLTINVVFDTNYLFLISPKGLNIPFLNNIYLFSNGLYSLMIFSIYLLVIIMVYAIYRIFKFVVDKYNQE